MKTFDYTKLANQSWPMEIVNLVAKIHEYKGRQDLFIRQKPVELTRLVEIAKIQSTESSNKIEGIVTTSTRMRQLMDDKTTPRNRDEDEIMGYRDVLNTIHESYDYIKITPAYILQLHKNLFRRSGVSYGGHFKSVQNYINETLPNGENVTLFTPIPPYDTPQAIDNLCQAYEQALAQEKVDPLILIPVFICDFLCIHPFNDGNGRMSRLLTLLLLYQNGYNVGKYISIEKKIEETKDVYYEVLQRIDLGWYEGKNDPVPFIKYLLQVILACYTDFEDRVGLISEDAPSNAYEIVKAYAAEQLGKFTSRDALIHCPSLSRSSIATALRKLTEEGYLVKKGAGRGTYYLRNDGE
ncbi:Fic family protein [Lactobacillus equicursoris]|uniref:Fic family protein n=1 Tax=Lactobacillus equicursoris TaxID=420645 RepID=UPI00242CC13D|nr:Fic family protein [Lactobacillus equicursoris]MDD6385975.1 Fic family protein [Lactobacillus equicursoris]